MVKKIFFWSFYILFVSGLIWGAINRTSAILEDNGRNREINTPVSIVVQQSEASIPSSKQENSEHTEIYDKEWQVLYGEISALGNRGATVILENGIVLSLKPRSWRFALEEGLQVELGDALLLTGFYENEGDFKVAHLRNLDNESFAQIRDESGHPLWEGKENGE